MLFFNIPWAKEQAKPKTTHLNYQVSWKVQPLRIKSSQLINTTKSKLSKKASNCGTTVINKIRSLTFNAERMSSKSSIFPKMSTNANIRENSRTFMKKGTVLKIGHKLEMVSRNLTFRTILSRNRIISLRITINKLLKLSSILEGPLKSISQL